MENGNRGAMEEANDYFVSYEDLEVHEIMLTDKRRNLAYKEAIENNKFEIEGKIVLDVGAGTGFLSVLCAKAGAQKVYAVEACRGMIETLKETCRVNEVDEIVNVIEGSVEDVDLPEKVDVIVSEWMGFYLVHEGMLSSVIHARDKFLKPEGVMIPDKSSIKVCLCKVPSLYDFWEDVDGVKLSHVGKSYRKRYENEPALLNLSQADMASDLVTVADFNLHTVTDDELQCITKEIVAVPKSDGVAQGLCLSFEVSMFGDIFSTSSAFPPTHWKQSVIVFPDNVEVEESEGLAYKIALTRSANPRRYAIELTPLEVEDVEHDIGCQCSLARCRIISAYIKEQEQLDDGEEENMDYQACNGYHEEEK